MTQQTHWYQEVFSKRFPVPVYDGGTIAIGSYVEWLVDRKRKDKHKPFFARGHVVKLYATTFGSTKRKQAAKIRANSMYLSVYPGRYHTTVSVDKLKLVV